MRLDGITLRPRAAAEAAAAEAERVEAVKRAAALEAAKEKAAKELAASKAFAEYMTTLLGPLHAEVSSASIEQLRKLCGNNTELLDPQCNLNRITALDLHLTHHTTWCVWVYSAAASSRSPHAASQRA
eukprot:gene13787-52528_t